MQLFNINKFPSSSLAEREEVKVPADPTSTNSLSSSSKKEEWKKIEHEPSKYDSEQIRAKVRDYFMEQGRPTALDRKKAGDAPSVNAPELSEEVKNKASLNNQKNRLKNVLSDGSFSFNANEQKILQAIINKK